MARAAFSYGINNQHLTSPNGCPGDPNNGPLYGAPYGFFENAVQTTCRNGDYVSQQSQGSGSHYSVFLNSKYVYNINAMYQLPVELQHRGELLRPAGLSDQLLRQLDGPWVTGSDVSGRRSDPRDRRAAGQRGALPDVERARPAAGEGDSVRVDGVGHRSPSTASTPSTRPRSCRGRTTSPRRNVNAGPGSPEPLGPAVVGARFLVVGRILNFGFSGPPGELPAALFLPGGSRDSPARGHRQSDARPRSRPCRALCQSASLGWTDIHFSGSSGTDSPGRRGDECTQNIDNKALRPWDEWQFPMPPFGFCFALNGSARRYLRGGKYAETVSIDGVGDRARGDLPGSATAICAVRRVQGQSLREGRR